MELSKDTMILMADGSLKAIQDILIGDRVMSGNSPNAIRDVMTGFEESLVVIKIDSGQELCITNGSFIETKDGVIPVGKLCISDFIKTVNGFMEVVDISEVKYNGRIYILSLEDACSPTYIANEIFIVGDMNWMNNQYHLKMNNNHQMPKSVLEELNKMKEEVNSVNKLK